MYVVKAKKIVKKKNVHAYEGQNKIWFLSMKDKTIVISMWTKPVVSNLQSSSRFPRLGNLHR